MLDSPQPNPKPAVARAGVLILLIGLGLRFAQATLGGTPVAAAAGALPQAVQPPAPGAAPAAGAGGPVQIYARVEWLSLCDATQTGLGLYTETDLPCQPSRTASLHWLQSQLVAAGMLAREEYLEEAGRPPRPGCLAQILNGSQGAPAGWLCGDELGLYRLDGAGQPGAGRLLLWIQAG